MGRQSPSIRGEMSSAAKTAISVARAGIEPASSEHELRMLIDSVVDCSIYRLDSTGHVITWNVGAARMKGYLLAEILGDHFSRFYTEEDRASGEPARALATAADSGKYEKEGWHVRKDGSRFWAHVLIDPIRSESGELIGFAKVTRDIT